MMPTMMNVNADPHEIQKFSELAHRWWDPTSEFRPLHEINPLRLEWINARAPLSGKAEASTRIRLAATQNIVVTAKTSKGAFYTASKLVKVTIGGCGG